MIKDLEKRKQVLKLNAKDLTFEIIPLTTETVPYEILRDGVEGPIERAQYSQTLANMRINIWVDEEYRLHDTIEPSIYINGLNDFIGGNVMFDYDGLDGETYGLTPGEIEIIKEELGDKINIRFTITTT